jgi:redox-sensitive bicupin YhaK (pirin superfamily)
MTAASGIVHDEFHSREFTRTGGTLEMVQLWVNLPAKDKMAAPGYQSILKEDIPAVALEQEGAGHLRVIAGEFDGRRGPARTFTSVDVWDVTLHAGRSAHFPVAEGRTLTLVILHGTALVNGSAIVRETQMATFERAGRDVRVEANGEVKMLLLSGEPIDEPVVGYGPFVMNSEAQIRQAIEDFNSGRLGRRIA